MDKLLVTKIQRFCLHDGPGIRTTIFFKGCSIRCPWCSNPENINFEVQYYKKGKEQGIYGIWMTLDEIFHTIIKDKAFYGEYLEDLHQECELQDMPGGVTLSGGEALLVIDSMAPLLERLHNEHIHIAVETSLYCSEKQLEIALAYIDLFYVDIKILDEIECANVIHGDVSRFVCNVKKLIDSGKSIIYRIPLIGGYTDTFRNKEKVVEFLSDNKNRHNIKKVEILLGHSLGNSKYESLNLIPPRLKALDDLKIEDFAKSIRELGIETEVCRI